MGIFQMRRSAGGADDRACHGPGPGRAGSSGDVHGRPGDPIAAAGQVEPAVARIDTEIHYQNAIGTGAGIVLDPGGQVLTNFHVVAGADRITASVAGRAYPAELVGYDRRRDIAVLQLLGARRAARRRRSGTPRLWWRASRSSRSAMRRAATHR